MNSPPGIGPGALRKAHFMNKTQAIRWLIEHRRADVPLQAVIHRLKAALSFDPQSMALLQQIAAEPKARPPDAATLELPSSRFPSRGYWNTMLKAGIEPALAWPIAMLALIDATGEPVESIRVFLDSRMGDQFARAVIEHIGSGVGLGRAVRIVTDAWMARSLDEIARLVYRLGELPFLLGWIRIMQSP